MIINVSIGELVDKVAILSIKLDNFVSKEKKTMVKKEYGILIKAMNETGISIDSEEFISLKKINLKLWNIENDIRTKEARKEFDADFINLARSVYLTNNARADIKKMINLKYHSDIIEEKEYVDYKT